VTLKHLRDNWEKYAQRDPLWAILSEPGNENNRWSEEEFFRYGDGEAGEVVNTVRGKVGYIPAGKALDFGCGIGRVTQGLAGHFEEAVGVDISPTMVALARAHNRGRRKCEFVLNQTAGLSQFAESEFAFVYSFIALQHIPPRFTIAYLKEFLRVLAPGGVLVFQLPAEFRGTGLPATLFYRLYHALYRMFLYKIFRRDEAFMEIYWISKRNVIELIEAGGGELVDAEPSEAAGSQYPGFRYIVRRR